MDREFDLIVVGELNPDLILRGGDIMPAFGQVEKLVEDAVLTIGSSAAIFACAAARLGLRVAFIGKVGDDAFGHFMVSQLSSRGIDTSAITIDAKQRTGLSVILSRGNDRAILTFPGAIPTFHFGEIPEQQVARGRHLHLTAYFIQDALRPDVPRLFDMAHRQGLTTSLDTNYDPAGQWGGSLPDCLARTDIFLPNATELCAITRIQDIHTALNTLALKIPTIAVKLGAEGAALRSNSEFCTAASLVVDVVDTVGAGDTFDAGLLYGILKGWDLERSLRLGCICGSLSTTGAGGTTAQPTLEEASRYL